MMTSPDDLIRRGDALKALPAGWPSATADRIRALPAAPLPDDVRQFFVRVGQSSSVDMDEPWRTQAWNFLKRDAAARTAPDPVPVPWTPKVGDRVDVADACKSSAAGARNVRVLQVNVADDNGFVGSPRISDLSPHVPEPCCGGREFCPASCDCKCHRHVPEPARDERPVDPVLVRARDLRVGDNIIDGDGSVQALTGIEQDDERVHVRVSGVGWDLDLDARVLVVRDRGQS